MTNEIVYSVFFMGAFAVLLLAVLALLCVDFAEPFETNYIGTVSSVSNAPFYHEIEFYGGNYARWNFGAEAYASRPNMTCNVSVQWRSLKNISCG